MSKECGDNRKGLDRHVTIDEVTGGKTGNGHWREAKLKMPG
jgi:hypothetical protein